MRLMNPVELAGCRSNEDIYIIDIREPYELEICTICAVSIPMGEIVSRIDEVPRDKHVVLMCKTGRRAAAVANMLVTEYDFTEISILDGGIMAWISMVDDQLESY